MLSENNRSFNDPVQATTSNGPGDRRMRRLQTGYRHGMVRFSTKVFPVAAMVALVAACGSQDAATKPATPTTPSAVATGCGPQGDLRLVYTGAAGEGGGDLFGLTRSGRVRRLTSDGGSFDPNFSPDGERIVFSSVGEHGSANGDIGIVGLDLSVMDADGSGRHRLLDGEEDGMPAWSPDGRRIAFVRQVDTDHSRVIVVDPDAPTSVRPLVSAADGAFDTDPAWSPDGVRVAFVRTVPDKDPQGPWRSQLIVVDADGSNARTVLERDEPFGSPTWSPDGARIAFTMGSVGERTGSVAVLDTGSGALRVLRGPGRAPVWSMSGRLYAYARNPAVADFSGAWRVAEFETSDRGVVRGRAIAGIDAIGYLYGAVGVDAPRCDGPKSSAVTSHADLPDVFTLTDPSTGKTATVMTRDEVRTSGQVERLDGVVPETKLVRKAALDRVLEWSRFTEGSLDLVWVASIPRPGPDGFATLLDARTGDYLGSGPNLTVDQWAVLTDLAR